MSWDRFYSSPRLRPLDDCFIFECEECGARISRKDLVASTNVIHECPPRLPAPKELPGG